MNRIFLKNIMTIFFWFYTGIILVAPVREVRHSIDEFRQKKSNERTEELEKMQKDLEDSRKKLLNPDSAEIKRKEESLNTFKKEHSKQEVIDFLNSADFKAVENKLNNLGLNKEMVDKIKRDKDFTEKDLEAFYKNLPNEIKSKNISFSDKEIEVIQNLFAKLSVHLTGYIEKLPFKDIKDNLNILSRSLNDQYFGLKDLFKDINFNKISNHLQKNIVAYSFLALNLLAIILMIVASKSQSSLVKSLSKAILEITIAVDVVGICFKEPEICKIGLDLAFGMSGGRTTTTTTRSGLFGTTTTTTTSGGLFGPRTTTSYNLN